jgi:hypothetical protein
MSRVPVQKPQVNENDHYQSLKSFVPKSFLMVNACVYAEALVSVSVVRVELLPTAEADF